MGRTIPSFRIAVEIERAKWRPFRLLLNKKDKEFLLYERRQPEFDYGLPTNKLISGLIQCTVTRKQFHRRYFDSLTDSKKGIILKQLVHLSD